MSFLPLLNTSLTQSVINVCEMFGKFVKFSAEMFSECQNVDRVKTPAKNLCMYALYMYMHRVYVAFILDMKIVFNNIINNSRPPAWYFSLTRTGNKAFTIVGLMLIL